ncbi:hypothetical protein HY285_00910 [Candidatus Peregrinibacteria bacterium]|nr:hypothetical protein [Candidatus Peregrinibacteria bacterium]MBI3816086.1 hypothetical protein [Candidatus Peregrinibacteria bacterium]
MLSESEQPVEPVSAAIKHGARMRKRRTKGPLADAIIAKAIDVLAENLGVGSAFERATTADQQQRIQKSQEAISKALRVGSHRPDAALLRRLIIRIAFRRAFSNAFDLAANELIRSPKGRQDRDFNPKTYQSWLLHETEVARMVIEHAESLTIEQRGLFVRCMDRIAQGHQSLLNGIDKELAGRVQRAQTTEPTILEIHPEGETDGDILLFPQEEMPDGRSPA